MTNYCNFNAKQEFSMKTLVWIRRRLKVKGFQNVTMMSAGSS